MFQAGVLKQLYQYNREGHAGNSSFDNKCFLSPGFPEDQLVVNQLQADLWGQPQNLVLSPKVLHLASVTLSISSPEPVHDVGGPFASGQP